MLTFVTRKGFDLVTFIYIFLKTLSVIIGIQGALQKINLQIEMGAGNLEEVVLLSLCIEMVDSGDTKNYLNFK